MKTVLARFTAARLSRWRSRFSLSRPAHLHLGRRGEKLAGRYLRRQGGEIDLVCRERDTLVFVEVKTRTREDFGRPLDAVNRAKQRRISLGGLAWLRLLGDPDIFFRFDIVEVTITQGQPPRLELIRNAFQLAEPYRY